MAVSKLLHLPFNKMLDSIGTSGTQGARLFQFGQDTAMSKQVHTSHAASTGLLSPYTARDRLTGAKDVLLEIKGMAKRMAFGGEDREALIKNLGEDWKLTESSFKVSRRPGRSV